MNISEKLIQAKADLDAVYEAGKKSEYDKFWDTYQDNGARKNYSGAFSGLGWREDVLNPKYDLVLGATATNMFFYCGFRGDLAQRFEDLGITFDTSKCTSMGSLFSTATNITRIGEIDIRKAGTTASNLVYYCSVLEKIDLLKVSEDNSFSNSFYRCDELKHIRFEGTIGKNINFQHSPLDLESAKSGINHLANFKGTANEGTRSVTFSSTTRALLDEAGAIFNGMTWGEYLPSIGWTF
jgi:hypothetical protein